LQPIGELHNGADSPLPFRDRSNYRGWDAGRLLPFGLVLALPRLLVRHVEERDYLLCTEDASPLSSLIGPR